MSVFQRMQDILGEKSLSLVQPIKTRWTAHAKALTAVIRLYEPIIISLQEIHSEGYDYSSEAGGLLAELQRQETAYILHASQ